MVTHRCPQHFHKMVLKPFPSIKIGQTTFTCSIVPAINNTASILLTKISLSHPCLAFPSLINLTLKLIQNVGVSLHGIWLAAKYS